MVCIHPNNNFFQFSAGIVPCCIYYILPETLYIIDGLPGLVMASKTTHIYSLITNIINDLQTALVDWTKLILAAKLNKHL